MTSSISTPDPAAELLSRRIAEAQKALATRWLERLDALLPVDRNQVFPSHTLLDHVPEIIAEIAAYLRAPDHEEIAANTGVMQKASELGALRYDQRASVHQLLREYQVLADVLDEFVEAEVAHAGDRVEAVAVCRVISRLHQGVRVLQQETVDTFVARYSETIERQTRQLRDFSRLVSHEIRQPLGVLQVVARMLHAPQGESERLVETLERNVSRLGEVAGKLERLTRLNHIGAESPAEQEVDLGALARDVARQLGDMAEARAVEIRVSETLPMMLCDPSRAELVLVNLLANAIKYSDPEKPVRVVEVLDESTPTHVAVVVRDNGIGIPAARLSGIFDDFVRAHADRDAELGAHGLGLGLSIVRECVEAMSGQLRVESVEGQGTAFTVAWPRQREL